MDSCIAYFILAATGSIVVLLTVIFIICRRFRRIVREKNRGIIRGLKEQDSLSKELDRVRTEKDTLEKSFDRYICQLTVQSQANRNNEQ